MKIYLLRHGQIEANTKDLLVGSRTDESLDAVGVEQARRVKIDADFDIIVSSPMKRTLETARIVNEGLHKEIVVDADIIERDKGDLEGKTDQEVLEATGGKLNDEILARDLEFDFSPYGGESAESVRARLNRFIERVKRDYRDKKVLVVTHQGVIRVLFLMYQNRRPDYSDNCEINILEV